jgi:outer membrane protein assembly factor BamB
MNRKRVALAWWLLLAVILFFCASCRKPLEPEEGFGWPSWRGPDGNGVSKETGWDPMALAAGAKVLWTVDVGAGYSNISIQNGKLYAQGLQRIKGKDSLSFQCLDAHTGKLIWRKEIPWEIMVPQSTPAVDGEKVYGLSAIGLLFCLSSKNGKLLWQKHLVDDFQAARTSHGWAASPIVEGDLLLVNANTLAIALDKNTGQRVWTVADEKSSAQYGSFATTVVSGPSENRFALCLGKGSLSAVEISTGHRLWSFPHGNLSHPVADPIVHGNQIFLMQNENCFLLGLSGQDPRVLWRNTSLCGALPTPVLVEGYLYCTHCPPENYAAWDNWRVMSQWALPFRCVEWGTGRVVWEQAMQGVSTTAADGKLLLLELEGRLHIVEATSAGYKEFSAADVLVGVDKPRIFATPPVLCEGKIYCRNFAGDLVCVDVGR